MKFKHDETTFCSTLEHSNIVESVANFVQFGHTRSTPSISSRHNKANQIPPCRNYLTLLKDSTFYGEPSDDGIQDCVITTTRKRSPLKDEQTAITSTQDLDASMAGKRPRPSTRVSEKMDY